MGGGEEPQSRPAQTEPTSPAEFLVGLGKALRENEDIDKDLADILAKHLLTATPAFDAVAKANDAIMKLAAVRANPPKPEARDG